MDRGEFNGIMRLLNDIWGGYAPSTYDTWFDILGRHPAAKVRDTVWAMSETVKAKPRIADIMEAMGRDIVAGGSGQIPDNGCEMCSSGWVMVEKQPREMVSMRCMCELGDTLNHKYAVLTPEHIKQRRWNTRGELRLYNPVDVERENKLQKLNTEETIAWCKKGLTRMANNMRF